MTSALPHFAIPLPRDVRLADATLLAVLLDDIRTTPAELLAGLDDEERARAETFRRDVHRQRFIRRRWWRRQALAELAAVSPGAIRIEHDVLGQPRMAEPGAARGWSLSTSHSGSLGVLLVSRSRPVGIDVACHDARHVTDEAARTFMDAVEYDGWRGLEPAARETRFFRDWARKEAVLKVSGHGFAIEPRLVHVQAEVVGVPGAGDVAVWDVSVRDGWAGAVAVRAQA